VPLPRAVQRHLRVAQQRVHGDRAIGLAASALLLLLAEGGDGRVTVGELLLGRGARESGRHGDPGRDQSERDRPCGPHHAKTAPPTGSCGSRRRSAPRPCVFPECPRSAWNWGSRLRSC